MTAELILASASPRRRELLQRLGVGFRVESSAVPEMPRSNECAPAFVRRIAREKAFAVAQSYPEAWVCGADTVVVADGEMLGKPTDAPDAQRMLRRLSGASHHVLTGVALVGPARRAEVDLVVSTVVQFRALDEDEITTYVASGEPMDKAGAYAIQGGAAQFVAQVVGSHTNVVGLPLDEVRELLQRHGLLGA